MGSWRERRRGRGGGVGLYRSFWDGEMDEGWRLVCINDEMRCGLGRLVGIYLRMTGISISKQFNAEGCIPNVYVLKNDLHGQGVCFDKSILQLRILDAIQSKINLAKLEGCYKKSKVSPFSLIIFPTLSVPATLSSFITSHFENTTRTLPSPDSKSPSRTLLPRYPPTISL